MKNDMLTEAGLVFFKNTKLLRTRLEEKYGIKKGKYKGYYVLLWKYNHSWMYTYDDIKSKKSFEIVKYKKDFLKFLEKRIPQIEERIKEIEKKIKAFDKKEIKEVKILDDILLQALNQ
jgi:hypothetical protein